MMPMLAQEQLQALPDMFWKNFCIALLVLLGAAGVLVLIWASLRKPDKTVLRDDPAIQVEKKSPRFNYALAESRHNETFRRLDGHDAEFEALWNKMRDEDATIRRETGVKFDAILLSLGEIKGEIKKL